MKNWTQHLAVILLLASLPTTVPALETDLRGFGTASLSCFSSDDADFVLNDQPKGPGRSGTCDTGLDSLIGVQFDLIFNPQLEFGLQLVSDRNQERDYDPDLELAQLRWRPTDHFTLRLGRMPTPTFLHSEDRLVRYAMPWVRPPVEVYSLLPAFSNDGVEFIYEHAWGQWHSEWQAGITTIEFDTLNSNSNDAFPVESDNLYVNLSLSTINTEIKFGYYRGKVTIENPDVTLLLGGLRFLGGPAAELADDLEIDDTTGHVLAIGLSHEQNDWLVMSEIAYRQTNGFIRDQYGAYITVGKRFDMWMPYATLARRWTTGADSDSRASVLSLEVEALYDISKFDNTSVSLGLSRTLTPSMILKTQLDWIQPDDDSLGLYFNHGPDYDFDNPDDDWLFSLSLDFIF